MVSRTLNKTTYIYCLSTVQISKNPTKMQERDREGPTVGVVESGGHREAMDDEVVEENEEHEEDKKRRGRAVDYFQKATPQQSLMHLI